MVAFVADKLLSFDPPGAIGLVPLDAAVLLRFDETDDAIRPKDDAGGLNDLGIVTGLTLPAVISGSCGRARSFSGSTTTGFVAQDQVSGSTLFTRDLTIQVIARWDEVGQASYGSPGSMVQRGYGFAIAGSAETRAYALVIDIAGLPAGQGRLQWQWQDVNGNGHVQVGAVFTAPVGFTMFTATRRWVSPTEVLLRYFIGDVMIGEETSANGSIGGATVGTMQIGTSAMLVGFGRSFVGDIDELAILGRELTPEEIQATWLRITRYQPLGRQLLVEMHDPGFPLPSDPGSDVQMDLRMIGHGLGYAAALAERVRTDLLPQRAYGSVLEDWEEVVRATPAPPRDFDTRRARVLARLAQRRGCSIDGIKDILPGLLGGGTVDDLEFIALSNKLTDDFSTFNPLKWDVKVGVNTVSGKATFTPGPGTYTFDGLTRDWITMRQTVGGDGKQARQLVKMVWSTPQSNAEAGIYFENATTNDYLLLGLRDLAGSFRIETESFIAGVSQGVVQQAIIGANPSAIWLHLYQTTTNGIWKAAWSTTSATAGYTISGDITHPTVAHWAGCYLRSLSALGGGPVADFDDHILYVPFSGRALNAYVLLDRALGFTPDVAGADSVISAIKHAFTHAAFITNPELLADDPDSGADLAPTGGY